MRCACPNTLDTRSESMSAFSYMRGEFRSIIYLAGDLPDRQTHLRPVHSKAVNLRQSIETFSKSQPEVFLPAFAGKASALPDLSNVFPVDQNVMDERSTI